MSKRPAPTESSGSKKKAKREDIAAFFSSPKKAHQADVIALSSDSEPEVAPVASTSKQILESPKPPPSHPFFASRSFKPATPAKKEPIELDGHDAPSSSKKALSSPTKTFGAIDNSGAQQQQDQNYALDVDIFAFEPARDVDASRWPKSKAGSVEVPYAFLTASFVLISATKSRLSIVTILTNTLRTILHYSPKSLLDAVYLITNHVAPSYEGVELGIGSQVLSKSIKDVSGTTAKQLKVFWNQFGDAGDVAFAAKSAVRTLIPASPLTVSGVYSTLLKICALKGQGVTNQKSSLVTKMLVSARGEEVRFLVRTLVAHLRIGAVRLTVTSALARCFCLLGPGRGDFAIDADEMTGLKAAARTAKEGKDDPRRKALIERLQRAEALVRRVYVRHPNYDDIIPALLDVGLSGLEEAVPLSVGTPLCNMLGQITRNLEDVSERLQPETEFAAEYKYDGQRVQIHARRFKPGEDRKVTEKEVRVKGKGGKWVGKEGDIYVRLFSRHLEDMTEKYPDLLALIPELAASRMEGLEAVESFVMDAEIVAIDADTGALLNFQTLSNRAKKDVQLGDVKVKAKVFAFDLMHLNGRSLLTETFRVRRELLHRHFLPLDSTDISIARFAHVASLVAKNNPDDLDSVAAFMAEAVASKCEGLMIKILDHEMVPAISTGVKKDEDDEEAAPAPTDTKSPKKSRRKLLLSSYEPDKRADSWMKVKKDYSETGGDSLDLVPIGVWHGQGRKAGWWSPMLLAVYDPERDVYSAVCKCISGFTDQFYKDLNERYPKDSETCSKLPFVDVETGLQPQWYIKPNEVWEIRGADITLSPVYPAAKGKILGSERGLSLRFPRFMKLRDDKSVTQATTPDELAEAYQRQESGRAKDGPKKVALNVADIQSDEDDDMEDQAEEYKVVDTLSFD